MKEYQANRLSGGNRLFPAQIKIDDFGVTLKIPGVFSGEEKSLGFHQISSIKIDSPLVGFSKITFDTIGWDRVVAEGFEKADADEIKQVVQRGILIARGGGGHSGGGGNYPPPQVIFQQAPKTAEQILAEAKAAKIQHQIDMEQAAEVEESDKKFYSSIKKYWYVWVTLIVVIAIGIAYTTFKTANEKKEAANMSLQLEQIEDQIKLAIQDGDKEQALELANKLVLPIHAIYEDKGGILSTVYYDTYWNDKREEYKKIILDMKEIDKTDQLGTNAGQELDTERAEKLKNEETGKLLAYFTKNNVTPVPTASGIYIITQNAGAGRPIVKTDFVTMDLIVSTIEGTKIFSTSDRNKPIIFEFGQPFDTKGFDEAIATMKKGSKAIVIVPSTMGVGDKGKKDQNGNETIPPYSPIVYEIEVLDIKTQAEGEKAKKQEEADARKAADEAKAKEPMLIQKYLKDNKITTTPSASGLYYVEKVRGTGPKATAGEKVKVHYRGKLFSGKIFDSSLDRKPSGPYEFTLGRGEVIPGWDEGIAMMNVGAKGILIIPSKLAYGANGSGSDIPPFSPMVFEVELVSIGD